jgi:N-acyl-L-homoserine lactone synthetase
LNQLPQELKFLNGKKMANEVINKEEFEVFDDLNTFYFVAKDKENDFYWVLNLDDHPNSFLLDKSFQHLVPSKIREGNESMVIKQPLPPM